MSFHLHPDKNAVKAREKMSLSIEAYLIELIVVKSVAFYELLLLCVKITEYQT